MVYDLQIEKVTGQPLVMASDGYHDQAISSKHLNKSNLSQL